MLHHPTTYLFRRRIVIAVKESLYCDLTDDVELDDVTLLRIGRDLALVLAFVACLHVLNLQGPSVRRVHEKRLEPFVRDKHGSIYREDMRIPSSDPRHLSYFGNKQICFNNIKSLHRAQLSSPLLVLPAQEFGKNFKFRGINILTLTLELPKVVKNDQNIIFAEI